MTNNDQQHDATMELADGSDSAPFHHRLPIAIHSQYIKDLSFENPNAPGVMRGGQGRPTMDVDFTMDARKIKFDDRDKDFYEVTLGVRAQAVRNETLAFILELEYAVLVSLAGEIPQEHIRPLLLIEVPRLAFPFVRQIVADQTQQAGFMPLLMAPVDFTTLYMRRFGAQPQDGGEHAVKKTA